MLGWLMRFFAGGAAASASAPARAPAAARDAGAPPARPASSPPAGPSPVAVASPVVATPDADAPVPASGGALLRRTEILDREQNVTGYAFELREELTDRIRAPGRRVRDFVDGLLVEQIDRFGRGAALRERIVCLRVWDGFLGQEVLARLAGVPATLLVQPEMPARAASAELLGHIERLRAAGLRIALDCNEPGAWLTSLLPAADAAVFRMGFCVPEEVVQFVRAIERLRPDVPVWAWEVGTLDDFELAREAGCAAFSGGFVMRRDDWKGNRLSPHGVRLASLLDRLRSGVDTHEIAAILKHDMALAYRLLRYVNAAAWGLKQRITSVEQAIVVLGQQALQRWVSMMIMGTARATPGAAVVLEAALVRARFLELLGALRGERDPAAQLFVLGLFSMLDVALKVPLEDALRPLNLSEPMQDALLALRGPMAPYLELALALERGNAERIRAFASVLNVSLGEINRLQFEALEWVQAAEG
jgi:EAL and modified HD-GYP domain-containing signal transduction protein